jgi:hypothetical protein
MTGPLPLLGVLAGLALAAYTLACWLAPFGPCGRCGHTDPLCRACDGTGRRVRLGRRAWTYLRHLYQQGTR